MLACWHQVFPHWNEPWLVPFIAVVRLTELARYAAEPVGNVLSLVAVVGAIALWRRGQTPLVGMLVWPIALNAVAWLLSSYPLASSRVVAYAIPAVLLLIAAGIPPAFAWLSRWGRLPQFALVVLLLVPSGLTARILFKPWNRFDSRTPTAFVLEHRHANEPVVGMLWEQAYYCRGLGPYYIALESLTAGPQLLMPPRGRPGHEELKIANAKSLWLLSSLDPEAQTAHVAMLQPAGEWQIAERHEFRDVVVLRVKR